MQRRRSAKVELVDQRRVAAFIGPANIGPTKAIQLEYATTRDIHVRDNGPNSTQMWLGAPPGESLFNRVTPAAAIRGRRREPIADHRSPRRMIDAFDSDHTDEHLVFVDDSELFCDASRCLSERLFDPRRGRSDVIVVGVPDHPSTERVARLIDRSGDCDGICHDDRAKRDQ